MDVEEARRRLAANPPHGDPTAEPGETLAEKAARLARCGNDPDAALTPGRAAFEAWMRIIYPDQADGVPYEAIHPGQRVAWESAAQAAIEAQDRTNARVWCSDHDSYCDIGTYHQPVPGKEAAR